MNIFIIPNEAASFWTRAGTDQLTIALNEKHVGVKAIPSRLQEPIDEWCARIRQKKWGAYPPKEFLEIGKQRIQRLANWLPIGWTIVLEPGDYPADFADRVLKKQRLDFRSVEEVD